MDQRGLRTPALLFATAGVGLVVVGRLGLHPAHASPVPLGDKRQAALLAGIALTVAGFALLSVERQPVLRRGFVLPRSVALAFMAVATLLLAWALLGALDQSLWHDEAFSVLQYSSRGPSEILFGDYIPNDHVLFNLLAWVTTSVLGESEITYRLWSVLPALAAVGLMVWWSWSRFGTTTAVAVALLTVTSPLLLLLAREARGYGLAFLAGALTLVFADRFSIRRRGRDLVGFGVAGLIGAATLPVFALAFVGQALPLMARRADRARVTATVAAVGAILLIVYTPVLGDLLDSTGQQFGRRLAWHGPLTAPMTDLLEPNVQFVFTSTLPPPLPDASVTADSAIGAAITLLGAFLVWRAGERLLCMLLVVPVLVTYLVLTATRVFVEPRFASFVLFHALVLAACGIVGLIALLPSRRTRAVGAVGVVVAAAFATLHTVRAADLLHDLPRENFKQVAAVVRAEGGSSVLTDSTRPQGLQYYLGAGNVLQLPAAELERRFCSSRDPLFYVEHPFRGAGEPAPPNLACLRRRGARMVRVRQRERGGHIDVWRLPAAGAD